jgi:hypothetical protein
VAQIVAKAEVIVDYPDDPPFSSVLLLGNGEKTMKKP